LLYYKLFELKSLQWRRFFDMLRVSSGQGEIPDRWCCLSLSAFCFNSSL